MPQKYPAWAARESREVDWVTVEGSRSYYLVSDKFVMVALNKAKTKEGNQLYGIIISYPNRSFTLSLFDAPKLISALDKVVRFAKDKEGVSVEKLKEVVG